MAEYNNQSIDIDLEEIFNGLSDKDQEKFLIDMFTNLPDEKQERMWQKTICGILITILLSTSFLTSSGV